MPDKSVKSDNFALLWQTERVFKINKYIEVQTHCLPELAVGVVDETEVMKSIEALVKLGDVKLIVVESLLKEYNHTGY